MRHGSLFSGIGGFDLAAEWMGWENIFHCEWNPFGQKVLHHYWPNAESFTDITKSDFTKYNGTIDIISGGFPCQPYSAAGKRKGKEDERHLWPEMLRTIREVQPVWVVGENVLGLVNWSNGLVFHEVQSDLEAEGYEVFPYVLPACAKDAPHRRDRVWFVAYSESCNAIRSKGCDRGKQSCIEEIGSRFWDEFGRHGEHGHVAKAYWPPERYTPYIKSEFTPDTGNQGLQRGEINGSTTGIRTKRKEQFAGLLQPTWQEFPTQSPVRSGNDGLPSELHGITISKWNEESLKAAGNAIVPQIAYEIFKAIQSYSTL